MFEVSIQLFGDEYLDVQSRLTIVIALEQSSLDEGRLSICTDERLFQRCVIPIDAETFSRGMDFGSPLDEKFHSLPLRGRLPCSRDGQRRIIQSNLYFPTYDYVTLRWNSRNSLHNSIQLTPYRIIFRTSFSLDKFPLTQYKISVLLSA